MEKITLEAIERLIDKFSESGLSKMKIKEEDFEFSLERQNETVIVREDCGAPRLEYNVSDMASVGIIGGSDGPTSIVMTEKSESCVTEIPGHIMKAPIVGTFYVAPAPDKPPFVTVGQSVKKGDILYIIESMKLMNEVASEVDGIVAEIFVENGQGIEYGEPVMRIQ